MKKINQKILTEMVKAIVKEIDPESIIYFGSFARGEAKNNSDIDLLIIEEKPFRAANSRRKEIARVRRAISGFRFPKDILIYSREEVLKWQNSVNHIIHHCLREGKVLYEKGY